MSIVAIVEGLGTNLNSFKSRPVYEVSGNNDKTIGKSNYADLIVGISYRPAR